MRELTEWQKTIADVLFDFDTTGLLFSTSRQKLVDLVNTEQQPTYTCSECGEFIIHKLGCKREQQTTDGLYYGDHKVRLKGGDYSLNDLRRIINQCLQRASEADKKAKAIVAAMEQSDE